MAENSLGNYLRTLRKSNGYSQEFVASSLNVIRQTYSHYETRRIIPPIESLYNLAVLYHISADSLLAYAMQDLNGKGKNSQTPAALSQTGKTASETHILTTIDSEVLSCYHQLDTRDQEDILDFMKLKLHKKECPNN